MGRVKGRNTKPEKIVRSIIHRMGFRFRLYGRNLPGSPDIVLTKHRKVIFVHGCFWHGHKGCSRSSRPASNKIFWRKKLDANIERDKKIIRALRRCGWKSLVIWACQAHDTRATSSRIRRFLDGN